MTSKISYFRIALEDLRHRTWMLALSCLGSLLALPVFFLLANRSYVKEYERMLEYVEEPDAILRLLSEYIQHMMTYNTVTCGIILMVGAIIVGILGYRYLYSRKMVDLYHSIPVKRGRMFFITYLNGLLIWLVPMALSLLITLAMMFFSLARIGYASEAAALLKPCGLLLFTCLLAFLTVYHFCLVCVMLCGNAFNAICTTVLGGCSVVVLWTLTFLYSSAYLKTFVSPYLSIWDVSWLSPLVNAVCILLRPSQTADGISLTGGADYWIISILMIAVMLAAAYLLYKKRPSELAEHGIENKPLQHILRVIVSLTVGMAFALMFAGILDADATGWILFGSILGAFLAFGILNIIFHMDFRAFFKYKWEMALTIIVACLVFPIFKYDLTGFNQRLPKSDDISEVHYSLYGFYEYYDVNRRTISYEDTADLYRLLDALTDESHLQSDYGERLSIDIDLKNGHTFSRSYRLQESDLELLRPIIEDEKYMKAYYPCSTGQLGMPSSMTLDPQNTNTSYNNLTDTQIKTIMEAYYIDFAEHSSLEELTGGITVCEITVFYQQESNYRYGEPYYINRGNLHVYDTYTNTIAAIRECFPDCVLTLEDMDIEFVEFLPEINLSYPKDALYSYFGVNGYVDYDTYVEEYEDNNLQTADTYSHEDVDIYSSERYCAAISDPDEIADLLPYLHAGNKRYCAFPSLTNQNIYLGEIYLTNGNTVSCYVKAGELPREWIDKISIGQSQYHPYYGR